MATQVETLLPGNPLAKAEEHAKVIRREPLEEEESGRGDGAKRQTGVAEQGSSSNGDSPGHGGTSGTSKQEERKEGCDINDKLNEDGVKSCNKKEFTEAPPPKVNPWTRKMNAVTVVSVNGQAHHESSGPAKVVRAGNPPKARRGGKVGDFGDANSWPTPGEIATKDMQIEAGTRTVSCTPQVRDSWRSTGHKKTTTTTTTSKKESKEKREIIEESKENLKAKSDDSGEEKNGDDDSQRNGPKKKGKNGMRQLFC